ncbi:MAG: DUF4115 domain-containing protein [Bacillota bacterium]|nr:DUF4115 domain-containing protein [Bacillota bacterium]
MQEIGGRLRAERERQGRSLDEVHRTTHITTRYLESLEAGEFEVIPGEVYLKGFLRRYAEFLGLDGEELIEQYRARRAESQATTPAAPESAPWRQPAGAAAAQPNRPLRFGLVIVALTLAAAATGWALAIWSVRAPAPARPPQVVEPRELPAPIPTVLPAPPRDGPQADAEPAPPAAPVRVRVELSDRCWFRVAADGQVVYQGELPAGAETEWTAQDRLTVRIGNPEGVRLTWNGRPVDLESQEPVTRLFTREAVIIPPPPPPPPRPAPTSAPPAPPAAPASPEAEAGAATPSTPPTP